LKWWWRYANEEDPLWKKVVQSMHKESDTIISSISRTRPSGQSIWQAIKTMVQDQQQVSKVFLHNLKLEVGNGAKVRFWEDSWTPDGPLLSLFSSLYRVSNQQFTLISNMGWFEGTIWKWTLIWKRELTLEESQQHNELLALLSLHHPLQNQADSLL